MNEKEKLMLAINALRGIACYDVHVCNFFGGLVDDPSEEMKNIARETLKDIEKIDEKNIGFVN